MKSLTDSEREELRHVVLEILAVRHPAALPVHSVARHARTAMGIEIPESDVTAACELLRGFAFADFSMDELGATKYWRATSAGVLKYERRS